MNWGPMDERCQVNIKKNFIIVRLSTVGFSCRKVRGGARHEFPITRRIRIECCNTS